MNFIKWQVLKPCPFCGSPAEIRDDGDGWTMDSPQPFWVQCIHCPGMMKDFYTADWAAYQWNLRHNAEVDHGCKPSIEDATTKAAIPSVNLVSFFGMLMMIISLVAGGLIGIVASIISFVCACNVMCRLVKMNFSKTNATVEARGK
jgi:hypothetical protein